MKVFGGEFTTLERNSLWQKMRLARASERHGARLKLSFAVKDRPYLAALDRETLRAWAGPELPELVAEVDRAGRTIGEAVDVIINKLADGPQEAKALRLRAEIFGELVRFSVAERRLAAPRPPAKVARRESTAE